MNTGEYRQKQLEIQLSQLAPTPNPKLHFESYPLDAQSAARMLRLAGYAYDDIIGKRIVDLGCGSGVLAIGAALIGGRTVVGVDVDRDSVLTATENATRLGLDVEYIVGDIETVCGSFDTVLMNPPFGSWHRGADCLFLKKAVALAEVVYSLHKRTVENRRFLTAQINVYGGKVESIHAMDIVIPRTYAFHKQNRFLVKADLYRITSVARVEGV
jgi:putative methylase